MKADTRGVVDDGKARYSNKEVWHKMTFCAAQSGWYRGVFLRPYLWMKEFLFNQLRHCETPLLYLGGEAIPVLLGKIASGKEQERLAMT